MTTFHYPRPEQSADNPWEALSDEAQTALGEAAMGPHSAEQLPLEPDALEVLPRAEHEQRAWIWAQNQLEIHDGALDRWCQYDERFKHQNLAPELLRDLVLPNLSARITQLYMAYQTLLASGEETPKGDNIGEMMRLVLVPWREMRDNLGNFEEWVGHLRRLQDSGYADETATLVGEAIASDWPIYNDPADPRVSLTSSQYLDARISRDGPWGLMLMQAGSVPGLERFSKQSLNSLMAGGRSYLRISNINLDAMGVFEWMALTLQEGPDSLKDLEFRSWLPANRIKDLNYSQSAEFVPYALTRNQATAIYVLPGDGGQGGYSFQPRLAIL